MIFYTLTLVVLVKYVCLVLVADDHGEGEEAEPPSETLVGICMHGRKWRASWRREHGWVQTKHRWRGENAAGPRRWGGSSAWVCWSSQDATRDGQEPSTARAGGTFALYSLLSRAANVGGHPSHLKPEPGSPAGGALRRSKTAVMVTGAHGWAGWGAPTYGRGAPACMSVLVLYQQLSALLCACGRCRQQTAQRSWDLPGRPAAALFQSSPALQLSLLLVVVLVSRALPAHVLARAGSCLSRCRARISACSTPKW